MNNGVHCRSNSVGSRVELGLPLGRGEHFVWESCGFSISMLDMISVNCVVMINKMDIR